MDIDKHGLQLIKTCEGYREMAYLCPAGIWTVGYGHTSMAGEPHVSRGMRLTRPQAEKVLARDLEDFANGVHAAIRVDLTDHQFVALVSFAYNVGLGAFRTSSVLRAVNARDFESVPRRLNLWVKAGPRVLPGLVKRRAAEGALFMMPEDAPGLMGLQLPPSFSTSEYEAMDEARGQIEPLTGTPMVNSTTNIAAVTAGVTGVVGWLQDQLWQLQSIGWLLPEGAGAWLKEVLPGRTVWMIAGAVVIGGATGWIISERWKKSRDDAI